jgi:phage terminase Nu1 subunit (DNA packaging protein)
MEFDANQELNTTALAAVLGITARRVRQLQQDGIIKGGKGKIPLAPAIAAYIDFRTQEKSSSRGNGKQDADAEYKKAKATIMTLEAQELQGKMHRSEDVEKMTAQLVYAIRGVLLALPGRLAVDVYQATSAAEASDLIRQEVHAAMEELSHFQYNPSEYSDRVRERRAWERVDVDDVSQDL